MKHINHTTLNTIGGVPVFTLEGAVKAYKAFATICYKNLSLESSCALSTEADKLHAMGFGWDEIEAFEIEAIQ